MRGLEAVGVVLHPSRDSVEAVAAIMEWSRRCEVQVLALADEVGRIDADAVPVSAQQLVEAGLLLGLGGDGTMLRTLRLADGLDLPVLGVNVGKLGFLAEVDVPELADALNAIHRGDYTTEPRSAVIAEVDGQRAVAFNDVALVRTPGTGLAAVELWVEGEVFVRYAADAVIVATPTGSTAYSFSAGGPLVSPTVQGLLVTPASPHSAFNRTLVLDTSERVTLAVLPHSGRLAFEVDGMLLGHVEPGQHVHVRTRPDAARVVRLGGRTFYQRAQRKLRLQGSAEIDN